MESAVNINMVVYVAYGFVAVLMLTVAVAYIVTKWEDWKYKKIKGLMKEYSKYVDLMRIGSKPWLEYYEWEETHYGKRR